MTELKRAEVAYWDNFIEKYGIDKAYEHIATATPDIKNALLRAINKYHEKQQDRKNAQVQIAANIAAASAAISAIAVLMTMIFSI